MADQENLDQDDLKDDKDDDQKDAGKQDDTEKGDDKADEPYKGRLTQFQAKNADEYIAKLEKGYVESSTEGQRLNGELTAKEQEFGVIQKVIQADPALRKAFADKLYGDDEDEGEMTPAKIVSLMREVIKEEVPKVISANPALQSIENTSREKDREVFVKFQEEHPDLVTNPVLAKEFEETFGVVAQMDAKKNNGVYNFERSIEKAWKMVADDDTAGEAEKNNAASGIDSTTKKSKGGRELSPAEKAVAQAMGLSDEGYLEGKKMSEEAKKQ